MSSRAINEVQRRFADVRSAEAAIVAARDKLAQIRRQGEADAEELARLTLAEEQDAASRIVDGADSAPEKPKRVSRIRNLREKRPQMVAAITLQERRIADARAAVEPLAAPLASASLHLVAEVQGNALEEIRTALVGLSAPAARLLASDQILAGLLGTNGFPIPTGAPVPINGARLLEGLLKAIPANILPESLASDHLNGAARSISQPILSEIKDSAHE